MQSGISVSPELQNAFNRFASDTSLFCLPVTITNESLAPLSPIPFSAPNAFYPSLSQLNSVLEPKTPIYLLLRQPEAGSSTSSLIALTYIPSNAGVRAKTLFASTRATLARELGTEKFASTIFATEEEEVVGESAWKERDAEKNGSGGSGGFQREDLMGEKERELEAVRRAEEEARNGTPSRDIGIGGSFARGSGGNSPFGSGNRALQMPVDEDAKEALRSLQQGGLVQLVSFSEDILEEYLIKMANFYELSPAQVIDIPKETLRLGGAESSIDPNAIQEQISTSSPRYAFYHYPDSEAVVFIYTCPSGSSIKERMLYASSRLYALQVAEDQGLKISKKIEASSADEVSGERLHEEVNPSQNNGPQRGFARPKRPGRSLASAVALPEQENVITSPDVGFKRRQSSISNPDAENKRRRLSSATQDDHHDRRSSITDRNQHSPDAGGGAERRADRKPTRPAGGRDEERKRGQRLFGGLLGTLSQSSTSAAQRRRADIERRQKDKLKLQDEEYDELKKKRRGERAEIRKKEQRLYDEESMRTRHANLLAMAHFLKTRAEPVLYYKPWQLRPDDHAIIRDQIEDAEATISREVAEFEARYPPQQEERSQEQTEQQEQPEPTQEANAEPAAAPEKETEAETDTKESKETAHEASHPTDAEAHHEKITENAPTDVMPPNDNNVSAGNDHSDVHRGHEDDGGEVVEDQEDTIHGFPDLSMGWRYQIPMLRRMGLRVVAPDCLGYGRTDAPDNIALYSHKSCADDIKELASQLGASQIILGGHDWGAALAYRVALWHPDLISHLFTVCVPYAPPQKKFFPLEEMVKKVAPHFSYQLQFSSGELEEPTRSKEGIKKFLSALYGGRTPEKEFVWAAELGISVERMERVLPSRLLTDEELEYYATEFSRHGLHGPFNWYRTREINYKEELSILDRRITAPVLFIQALRDAALPSNLGRGMTKTIPHLTFKQVNTSHWALWEQPAEVNEMIAWWLEEVVFTDPRVVKL
ncbi:epoxide hydrolase [Aspergillus affinis]|uniref:epoxide hydrolase n=1 Tax=Aspergillus affinis TaxID=1070780 RepID=UPI0022FE8832|nr:epoxide hydrolase [Aspergillus affinis]KAI9037826.1 epoxide hydrolase [Aspergillus affinis]